ncbi:MAG TPA: plastocyanin/azurin family copper-binding protein [Candidatus Thermoplasmatota archaeon]|nr:plastocyanin/azurin family copper-binding protein [Candidatus Thermoplasmatota archaeon]
MKAAIALALLATAMAVALPTASGHTPEHKPDGFSSPAIPAGQSWNRTFEQEGTAYYHCHPHPWMEGIVRVDAAAPQRGLVLVRMREYRFDPAEIHVAPGTLVEWVNDDNDTHFVVESKPPPESGGGSAVPTIELSLAAASVLAAARICRRPA